MDFRLGLQDDAIWCWFSDVCLRIVCKWRVPFLELLSGMIYFVYDVSLLVIVEELMQFSF